LKGKERVFLVQKACYDSWWVGSESGRNGKLGSEWEGLIRGRAGGLDVMSRCKTEQYLWPPVLS